MRYRADIDGLRAVAVAGVIIFHFDPEMLPGGFIGVDIFFVVSGYLITRVIWDELDQSRFSLTAFYERRLRRIGPALLSVITTVLLVSFFVQWPEPFEGTARSSMAAIGSLSNFYFWTETGYFRGTGALEPLLHTWSLGVEEQYYLAFPLLLMATHRFGAIRVALLLCVLGAVSLSFSEWAAAAKPSVAFYFTPSRAWELMIGSVLAVHVIPQLSTAMSRNFAGLVGVTAIVLPFMLYSSLTRFPGVAAVLPCLGTALIIHSGTAKDTLVAKLLATAPLVGVGLISYSLYLWHWPILVFMRTSTLSPENDGITSAAGLLLTFVLAYASWRFIEKPSRNRAKVGTPQILYAASASCAVIVACSIIVIAANGFPSRIPEQVLKYANASSDFSDIAKRCVGLNEGGGGKLCRFGPQIGDPFFAVWGDSHAAGIAPAFEVLALDKGKGGVLVSANSCPPLLGVSFRNVTLADEADCFDLNRRAAAMFAASTSINTVVVVANWPAYIDQKAKFSAGISGTLAVLQGAGKRLIIVGGLPKPGFDVPRAFALAEQYGRPKPGPIPVPTDRLWEALQANGIAGGYISITAALCTEKGCPLEIPGGLMFMDDGHLSATAARTVVAPYLRDIVGL